MRELSINSIYMASEGEGIHLGTPQIFVRFQGCNVGCINCDSKETWEFDTNKMEYSAVLSKIESLSAQTPKRLKRVSITGGDPLHPKLFDGVQMLARDLKTKGYFVNIEASGTRVVDSLFDIVDFISFDFKTPSTNVVTPAKNLEKIVTQYGEKAQIKSVITDKKDFEYVADAFLKLEAKLEREIKTPWVMTPCYEPHEEFPKDRFISIIDMNQKYGSPFKVIGQQHKWIHGPVKRDV